VEHQLAYGGPLSAQAFSLSAGPPIDSKPSRSAGPIHNASIPIERYKIVAERPQPTYSSLTIVRGLAFRCARNTPADSRESLALVAIAPSSLHRLGTR
jgi:hypothetical protein